MKRLNKNPITAAMAAFITLGLVSSTVLFAAGATQVNLSSATNFSVLAGSTITNTGSTVINGDLGLSPGTALTGFPPGVINGGRHLTDVAASQAEVDLGTAFTAAAQTPVSTVPADLGGTTKVAGVYASNDGSFGITGTLTLDAQGDPNAVFIFKSASTLITGGASRVVLANGAQACNVFWQVGSSATLGANSTFQGNILALTSATLTTGAQVLGRVLVRNGAVTLDSNSITRPSCFVASAPTPTPVVTPVATTTQTVVTNTPVIVTVSTTTVSVSNAAPQFPNTGTAPDTGISLTVIVLAGMSSLMALSTLAWKGLRKENRIV